MNVNANTPDQILSLLLEVAKCSFVRVTQFKKKQQIRYQLGELKHAMLIDGSEKLERNSIVSEQILHFDDYQFNVRIVSAHHAHIECVILLQADALRIDTEGLTALSNDSIPSVSIFSHCASIVIELVHEHKLPDFIIQLTTHINSQVVTQLPETEPTYKDQKWLSLVLLKTMLVSLKTLRLIDYYLELTRNSLPKQTSLSEPKRTLQVFPKCSLGSDNNSADIASAPRSVLSPNEWCRQFSQSVGNLLLSLNSRIILTVTVGSTIEHVLLQMVHKERLSYAKTAILLQIPISTARRRLKKNMPNLMLFENNINGQDLSALLMQIVTRQVQFNQPLDIIKRLIALRIFMLHPANMALASQLMGVSEPTMYKLRKQLQLYPLVY